MYNPKLVKIPSIFIKKKFSKNIDHFLDNSQTHYLKNVLKVKKNDVFDVFNGEGQKLSCTLKDKDYIEINSFLKVDRRFNTSVLIPFQERGRFEFCLQKVVEVGAKDIYCYLSEKDRLKLSYEKEIQKIERYREIIKSSFLQSNNFFLPKINILSELRQFKFDKFINKVVLQPESKELLKSDTQCDLLITGSRFGFSENELELFHKKGVCFKNLGKNILRAETAPLVGLAILNIK